jgi:hypothetical protein
MTQSLVMPPVSELYGTEPEISAAPINMKVLKSRKQTPTDFAVSTKFTFDFDAFDCAKAPDPEWDHFQAQLKEYNEKRTKLSSKRAITILDLQWEEYVEEHFPQYQDQDYEVSAAEGGPNFNRDGVLMTACNHEHELFSLHERNKVIQRLMDRLLPRHDEFDAIAISGYSMAMIVPIIADRLQKNVVLVRKSSEQRASEYNVEGIHGQRCVFVDDMVDSGHTFTRVYEGLETIGCTVVGYSLYTSRFNSSYIYKNYPDVSHWGDID